jgi:hypothetical protein
MMWLVTVSLQYMVCSKAESVLWIVISSKLMCLIVVFFF